MPGVEKQIAHHFYFLIGGKNFFRWLGEECRKEGEGGGRVTKFNILDGLILVFKSLDYMPKTKRQIWFQIA